MMLESSSSTTTTPTTTTINHSNVKRNNKENQTLSDAMTIPISLSSLSNQNSSNNLANSVIQQTNQQSVIQSAGGAAAEAVQLPKSIILFNKINQNSVIQSTENEILQNNRMDQQANNTETNSSGSNANVICSTVAEDESKRRREMLNRRPSYRKILNEISSADTAGIHLDAERENQSQQSSSNTSSQHIVVSNADATALAQSIALSSNSTSVTNSHTDQNNNDTASIPLQVNSFMKMIPTSTMQLASEQDLLPSTVQLGNHAAQHPPTGNHGIVHYASSTNPEPQFFISVNSDGFSTYQLRDPAASPVQLLNSNNVSNASSFQSSGSSSNNNLPHRSEEEQDKKRQLRLQKNREAAKECRRKKKEYIKCLEDRVTVLQQQNKTLIDELKTLKKLYCQQNE